MTHVLSSLYAVKTEALQKADVSGLKPSGKGQSWDRNQAVQPHPPRSGHLCDIPTLYTTTYPSHLPDEEKGSEELLYLLGCQ